MRANPAVPKGAPRSEVDNIGQNRAMGFAAVPTRLL
jgi:hypothetical protein